MSAEEGVKQSVGNMLLTDYFGQCLGTPFAVENLSHSCGDYYTLTRGIFPREEFDSETIWSIGVNETTRRIGCFRLPCQVLVADVLSVVELGGAAAVTLKVWLRLGVKLPWLAISA